MKKLKHQSHKNTAQIKEESSKAIARIIGPTLIVMVLSEMKFWNSSLYDTQIVPLIYLNGVLLFLAGLAIANKHNVWIRGWQTIITVIGYAIMIIGLLRMFFPQIQKAEFKNDTPIMIIEITLICIGLYLTFKAHIAKTAS